MAHIVSTPNACIAQSTEPLINHSLQIFCIDGKIIAIHGTRASMLQMMALLRKETKIKNRKIEKIQFWNNNGVIEDTFSVNTIKVAPGKYAFPRNEKNVVEKTIFGHRIIKNKAT